MNYFVCCKDRILHSVSPMELPLEVSIVEPLRKHGYEVIAVDSDDSVHVVREVDNKIVLH